VLLSNFEKLENDTSQTLKTTFPEGTYFKGDNGANSSNQAYGGGEGEMRLRGGTFL
jgi:hypothetical protein